MATKFNGATAAPDRASSKARVWGHDEKVRNAIFGFFLKQ